MGYIDGVMNQITRLSSKIVSVVQKFEYNKSHKRTEFNLQTRLFFWKSSLNQLMPSLSKFIHQGLS